MDINSLRERERPDAFTVSELNNYIKNIFESNRTLSAVSVKGEISNFTNHRSGHLYFSLKDEDGQIRAVMFRQSAARLKFMPESGMKVIVHGAVSVYARDGSYQMYVSSMQPDGIGALYLAYEQLKAKLSLEGLFDTAHKRALPKLPSKIGVITSPTGAAVKDILNVTKRRYPLADVYIYPALVQGEGAVSTLIAGIDFFDRSGFADVVIIGRGGGSIEDLWAFNDEALARRIFAAKVPIISAVGHETDFTICDFVSDLRAPTPSAAAELAVPDVRELKMSVIGMEERAAFSLNSIYERARTRFENASSKNPCELIFRFLDNYKKDTSFLLEKSTRLINETLANYKSSLAINAEKANAMSPLSILGRGYSIAFSGKKPVSSLKDVNAGDTITVRVTDGEISAVVGDIKEI